MVYEHNVHALHHPDYPFLKVLQNVPLPASYVGICGHIYPDYPWHPHLFQQIPLKILHMEQYQQGAYQDDYQEDVLCFPHPQALKMYMLNKASFHQDAAYQRREV